jgi:hypothetical protein
MPEAEEQAAEQEVARFIGACGVLFRLREALAALCMLLLVTGIAAAVVRLIEATKGPFEGSRYIWFIPALSFIVLFSRSKRFAVETEMDRSLGTGSLFCSIRQCATTPTLLTPVLLEKAASHIRFGMLLRAMNPLPARSLPYAFFGVLLALGSMLIPDRPVHDRAQAISALIASLRPVAAQASAQAGDPELSKEVLEAMTELERGELIKAALKAREASQKLSAASGPDPKAAEAALVRAGMDEATAKALATGNVVRAGGSSGVTAEALNNAAKEIGGAQGASLAEAARRIASGASVEEALREASAAARKLIEEQERRAHLLARIRTMGKEIFEGMTEEERSALLSEIGGDWAFQDPTEPVATGSALSMPELVSVVTSNPKYPLSFRTAFIEYYSMLSKGSDE